MRNNQLIHFRNRLFQYKNRLFKVRSPKVLLLPILSELRVQQLECDRALLTFAKSRAREPVQSPEQCTIFVQFPDCFFPPQLKPRFPVLASSADSPKVPISTHFLKVRD